MLTIAQAPRRAADIFDADKAATDLEKLAKDFGGREREMRTAVAQYFKAALNEGRAKAEELLLKDRHGRRCAERLCVMQD
jgi:[protein-PII] uridylyltransferase